MHFAVSHSSLTLRSRRIGIVALLFLAMGALRLTAQNLDVLYDLRHTTDPKNNPENFPALEFKFFKPVGSGSFLMKEEIDLDGSQRNASKIYTELSQTIAVTKSPWLLHLGYSGGLGLFNDATGGYYLQNCYSLGIKRGFQWEGMFINAYLAARYTNAKRPSTDPIFSLYVGKFFNNYKFMLASSLEAWTTNRNLGDSWNANLTGKTESCLLELEAWYKLYDKVSVGTYTRISYNAYNGDNRWVIYPSFGMKYDF